MVPNIDMLCPFVLEVSFFDSFIAPILSTKILIGSTFRLDNAKEKIFVNHIASLTAVDSAMYSAAADESATQLCLLDIQLIDSS